jgi:DNA-binding response OmpR family regulator
MAIQTVLLVEDDATLSEVVGSMLTLAGYRAVVIAEHALIPYAIASSRPGA